MRAMIRNLLYWRTLRHSMAAFPCSINCGHESREGAVETGSSAVTAATAATAAGAISGATSATIESCVLG